MRRNLAPIILSMLILVLVLIAGQVVPLNDHIASAASPGTQPAVSALQQASRPGPRLWGVLDIVP